jgi:hypothetical protein
VFPQYHAKGYVTEIGKRTIELAFNNFQQAEWLFFTVLTTNTKFVVHLDGMIREGENLCRAGEVVVPVPGYIIFGVKKERWLKEKCI